MKMETSRTEIPATERGSVNCERERIGLSTGENKLLWFVAGSFGSRRFVGGRLAGRCGRLLAWRMLRCFAGECCGRIGMTICRFIAIHVIGCD